MTVTTTKRVPRDHPNFRAILQIVETVISSVSPVTGSRWEGGSEIAVLHRSPQRIIVQSADWMKGEIFRIQLEHDCAILTKTEYKEIYQWHTFPTV